MLEIDLPEFAEKVSLTLVGVTIGIIGMMAYSLFTEQGPSNMEITSIVINSILTLALVGFYFRMTIIQEKQTTLAEIERTPLVEISGYEVEGDDLTVYLSNYGNGTATNFELVTVSHFDAESELLEPGASPEPLVRVVDDASHNYEQSIRPHDQCVEFTASPGFVVHRDQGRGSFPMGISMLESDGVEDVAFQLYVRYSTRTGKRYAIPLFDTPRAINVNKDVTFGDAYTVEGVVKRLPRFIPDPDYPLPPYLNEDAGHPPRRDELDF